jgi:nucleoside 2-deoxyribosyltransferase
MIEKQTIYIASPLFSQAELHFNTIIRGALEPKFNVYLPQEDGELLNDTVEFGGDVQSAIKRIFLCDVEAIRKCDILLIVLDGRTVDEGAAFELGVAFALGKTCFGLQTDPRRLLQVGNNPMISGPLVHIFSSLDELRSWAFSTLEISKSSITACQLG